MPVNTVQYNGATDVSLYGAVFYIEDGGGQLPQNGILEEWQNSLKEAESEVGEDESGFKEKYRKRKELMKRIIAILAIVMMVVSETAVCYAGKVHHGGHNQNMYEKKGHHETTATDAHMKKHKNEATATDVPEENVVDEIADREETVIEEIHEVVYDKELEEYINKLIRDTPWEYRTFDPEFSILKEQLCQLKKCYPEYSYEQLSGMLDGVESEDDFNKLIGKEMEESDEYGISLMAATSSTSTGSVIGDDWEDTCEYKCKITRTSTGKTTTSIFGNCLLKKDGIIPGLASTYIDENNSCDHMAPQGICIVSNYILISAYCTNDKHNSVLYVVDKTTLSYLCTFVLDTDCHVGGIAYDSANAIIWVCNSDNKTMLKYNVSTFAYMVNKTATTSEKTSSLSRNAAFGVTVTPSFCTYYDGMLWVGEHIETSGKVNGYIYSGGKLVQGAQIKCPQYSQGMTFASMNGKVYCAFSSSYGRKNDSTINSYTIPEYNKRKLVGIQLGLTHVKSIVMPSMIEGMITSGSRVYVIFESAAEEYYNFINGSIDPCDRICPFTTAFIFK